MPILNPQQREIALAALPEWEWDESRNGIARSFRFKDFDTAFDFMVRVAALAKAADHHPEWTNIWNRVDIFLTTHDAGGLSEQDVALAQSINSLLS